MRIVISGAAGFLGCHLARRYLGEGHEVIGLDNYVTGDRRNVRWLGEWNNFAFIRHDVTKPVMLTGRVDLVCNLACPASPADFSIKSLEILRVCSEGVRQLLELARAKEAVFLQSSTSEVYGDPDVHPQVETYWGHVNPIGPRSMYDEGKRFAEATIVAYRRRYGMPVRMARIFNTFGPRMRLDDGRVVTNFICQALAGQPLTIYGDGSQTRCFCYVDDLVEGLARLAGSDYCEPVNIGNSDEVTVRRLAEEIIELTGSASAVVANPSAGDDPKLRRPDTTLARKVLGWQPRFDRRDGLRLTIEYCRQILHEKAEELRATHLAS